VTTFDRYIAVDWSAQSRPKKGRDSIWIAFLGASEATGHAENPPTRRKAEARLSQELADSVDRHERVLIGFDFPYGYPQGLSAGLGLDGAPWKAVWDYLASHIRDSDENANNRFEVAASINQMLGPRAVFWGCPATRADGHLSSKNVVSYRGGKEANGLAEWRLVEAELRRQHHWPQSVWKLLGAGAVGSQTLLGIPVVHRLRTDPALEPISRVWPFEVGMPDPAKRSPAIVHAEIWPSLIDWAAQGGSCRDERQVRGVVVAWRDLDSRGALTRWFDTPKGDPAVRTEEGWILGVPA